MHYAYVSHCDIDSEQPVCCDAQGKILKILTTPHLTVGQSRVNCPNVATGSLMSFVS